MAVSADTVRAMLKPLIQQAKDEGKWLWCSYQDLWFSPNDLECRNILGNFLWGPVNWQLRDPTEHVMELEEAVKLAEVRLKCFKGLLSD